MVLVLVRVSRTGGGTAPVTPSRNNQTGAGHDNFYCDRQCRWQYGFFDRRIRGEKASWWKPTCECARASESLGSAPYYTPFQVAGPPTVPNGLWGGQCCEQGDDVPLGECKQPTGECHANVYPHAKPFDDDYWAGSYTTDWLCARRRSEGVDAVPFSLRMPKEMHQACMTDGDAAADRACQQGREQLEGAGLVVVHCGRCSACSSAHDVEVLVRTRDTITSEMTKCSAAWVVSQMVPFAARTLRQLKQCLLDRGIDFSDDGRAWVQPEGLPTCMDTWTDNILNDASLCRGFCLGKFAHTANSGNFAKDQCLQCDEYTSGPAFIKGAGANRRSVGLVSDIDRSQLKGTLWEQRICKVGLHSPRWSHRPCRGETSVCERR